MCGIINVDYKEESWFGDTHLGEDCREEGLINESKKKKKKYSSRKEGRKQST